MSYSMFYEGQNGIPLLCFRFFTYCFIWSHTLQWSKARVFLSCSTGFGYIPFVLSFYLSHRTGLGFGSYRCCMQPWLYSLPVGFKRIFFVSSSIFCAPAVLLTCRIADSAVLSSISLREIVQLAAIFSNVTWNVVYRTARVIDIHY